VSVAGATVFMVPFPTGWTVCAQRVNNLADPFDNTGHCDVRAVVQVEEAWHLQASLAILERLVLGGE
jgi:hypothetical protein